MKDIKDVKCKLCLKLLAHLRASIKHDEYSGSVPPDVIASCQETYGDLPIWVQFYLEED